MMCVTLGIDSGAVVDFIPALIALDKNRRVLSRVLSRENLEAYVEEMLREQ